MPERATFDIAVAGGGPAGLAAALSLAHVGARIGLVAPRPSAAQRAADTRTFAALGGSVDLLRRLGVWARLEATPLNGIRIVDDRNGLLRAPEVLFRATELGLSDFGANIAHAPLNAALSAVADATPAITWIDTTVTAVEAGARDVVLTLGDGARLAAPLLAAADGRKSLARTAAGIGVTAWDYPQAAVACVFGHSRSHGGVSTEFHGRIGPLTTVPMPDGPHGPRSSLVWVTSREHAAVMAEAEPTVFLDAVAARLQGLLGRLSELEPRAMFPLSALEAEALGRGRVLLIGEAGHVVPPIGAQGLNLGLRDAAAAADCIEHALRRGGDLGTVGEAFAAARARDVWTRVRGVDLLNRTLISNAIGFDIARGVGLHALAASSHLRLLAMRQGMEPVGERPRLMRP